MNKADLIDAIAKKVTIAKSAAANVVDAFIDTITHSLKKGEKVSITGFGSFWISCRPSRKGINPATKERIDLPEISIPRFKAGKSLREVVRSVRLG